MTSAIIKRPGFRPRSPHLPEWSWREDPRTLHQRERLSGAGSAAGVAVHAAGFRQVLGISIIPPYETYIL
jgi:hypothetical protein